MELWGSKIQLTPSHGNFMNDIANPEIVYMFFVFMLLLVFALTDFFKKNP